jgi:hypothetical protein
MSTSSEAVAETVAELIREVRGWAGVEIADHRFGGTEFTLGPREIGHVHQWGMLDIPYRRALRDALVAEGATGDHHLLPESGWTTFYIRSTADAAQARWLLRLSYLYHVSTLQHSGTEWVPTVNVTGELDDLAPSDTVRAAFERRQPTPA